jgi:DNA-binding winged helix-turn-helix (wHTH) protein
MQKASHQTYFFDEFQLDLTSGCLLRGRDEIKLRPQSFEVLTYLVENNGRLIPKEELIRAVWGNTSVSDDSLTQCLKDIRHKLGDEAQQIIKTVPKRGYIFAREASDNAATGDGPAANVRQDSETAGSITPDPLSIQHTHTVATPGSLAEDAAANESNDGMNTFEEWMRGPGKVVTGVLLSCIVVTLAISIALFFWRTNETKSAASLAQFVVILIALAHSFLLRRPRGLGPIKQDKEEAIRKAGYENFYDFEKDKDDPRRALAQYTRYWRWLLLSWVSLYAFLAITGFAGLEVDSLINNGQRTLGFTLSLFNTLFNNWNTLMLILCFHVLNKQIEDETENRNKVDTTLIGLIFFLVVVTVFAFLFVLPIEPSLIPKGASVASGVAGAIAMALFVGRLQSKFLGPRPWLLIALYSYTAIQPLFLYLEKTTVWTVLLIDLALILKCLLYLYVAWLLHSGRLLFYFVRMRRTYRAVGTQWKAFRKLLDQES